MKAVPALALRLSQRGAVTLARAPEGYDAFVIADLVRQLAKDAENRPVALVFVARDGLRAQAFIDALSFAAPEIEALYLPSWDCQPYDRVSPNAAISAQRMIALARLASTRGARERPRVLVASVNAVAQRLPPKSFVAYAALSAAPGNVLDMADLVRWLEANASLAPASSPTSAITRSAAASSTSIRRASRRRSGSIFSATRWKRSAPSIPRRSARSGSCARSISRR